MLLALPVMFFWATYEQQGNTIALWADGYTDRTINLLVWSGQIPVTWFQAFNPFMIFAFTPFVLALWKRQAGARPRALDRHQDGVRLLRRRAVLPGHGRRGAAAPAAARRAGSGSSAYFVVITIGELYLSPVGLSLVTKVAPARAVSMMMGVWLATSFTGNFLAGYLGSFWSGMDKGSFFLMIAVIAALAGPRHPGVRAAVEADPQELGDNLNARSEAAIAKCDRFKNVTNRNVHPSGCTDGHAASG